MEMSPDGEWILLNYRSKGYWSALNLKTGKDEFVSIMENMPETTCIIVCEPEVDKRSKVYKWIKKNGYVGEFLKKNQTEKVLLRWIAALLGKEKKQIRENNARYFLQKTGDDMFQIKMRLINSLPSSETARKSPSRH